PAEIMTFGRTFVPFRAVAELLGDVVLDYDSPTETIVAAKAPIAGQHNLAYYVNLFNAICL
ncbi:MAG: copper amine oxidase N-terminal domain-containing protein, partial [Oscillospiraceae bacterium]|nr:copper amine oxidase N-terminal domain-containing protein [Oscillospiraceae bacterium]